MTMHRITSYKEQGYANVKIKIDILDPFTAENGRGIEDALDALAKAGEKVIAELTIMQNKLRITLQKEAEPNV